MKSGIQRLHHNGINSLRLASASASSVRASERTAFPVLQSRSSKGKVEIFGGFTGMSDINLKTRIKTGSSARATSPVYAGGGNPSMSDIAIDSGLSAQTVQVRLVDKGTVDVAAKIEFFGVELVAKEKGVSGNNIYISVDDSSVITSGIAGYIQDPLTAKQFATDGYTRLAGPQWNFGAESLTASGELVPNSVRLRIGTGPAVYRHWRAWEFGGWVYYLDQELEQGVPKGTPVYSVTGTYEVTISDGATVEVYSGIVTLYDLLQSIRSRSGLIDVVGVVTPSRVPGSQGSDELPLKTTAYALLPELSGSEFVTGLEGIAVDAAAATQAVEIECTDNTVVGGELWSVSSSVLGALGTATTARSFSSTPVDFTIPKQLPDDLVVADGTFKLETQFVTRETPGDVPKICLDRPVLGALGENETLTLVWTAKPPGECSCDDMTITGNPIDDCLGIGLDEVLTMALSAETQARAVSLAAYEAINSGINSVYDNAKARLKTAGYDLDLLEAAVREFYQALLDGVADEASARAQFDSYDTAMRSKISAFVTAIAGDGGYSQWVADTLYAESNIVLPITRNGHYYICEKVVTGASGAYLPDEPDWPTDGGDVSYGLYDGVDFYTIFFRDAGPVSDDDILDVTDAGPYRASVSEFTRQFRKQMNHCRWMAGIIPKSEAGAATGGIGDECYNDPGEDAYYWAFENANYLPLRQGYYYHSVEYRYDHETGEKVLYHSKRFGFGLKVGCPERLQEGDKVIIRIGNVTKNYTYKVGDKIKLPIIAAGNEYLRDGAAGTNQRLWSVLCSGLGALSDYTQDLTSPSLYSDSGINFRINEGLSAPSLDAGFSFNIETGAFETSVDDAAWVDQGPILYTPIALFDGLQIQFYPGIYPSHVVGDVWEWDIQQRYSPSLSLSPGLDSGWQYTGSSANITIDAGASFDADSVCLWITGANGETITIEGLNGADSVLWTETPTATTYGLIAIYFSATRQQQKIRVSIPIAGCVLRWVWCGESLGFDRDASACDIRRVYLMAGSSTINRRRRHSGTGRTATLEWKTPNTISDTEAASLAGLVDWAFENDEEPIIVSPNYLQPERSAIAQIDDEEFQIKEAAQYQPSDRSRLRLEAKLDFRAVAI